jgi:hypothetical protein
MPAWTRRVALIYVTYWGATCTLQSLWTGHIAVSAENLVLWGTVPGIEAVALACAVIVWQRIAGERHPSSLSAFFAVWLVLTLALIPATLAITLGLFRTVDLTDKEIFASLAVPAFQAVVLSSAGDQPGRWPHVWAEVLAHRLVRPILLIDAVMLSLGLVLWRSPQIGIPLAPIQRHWVGIKLMAAAFFLASQVRGGANDGRRRGALAALALALAAVGLNAFTPWILAATLHVPNAINRQPLPLLWLEWFGAIFTVVLLLVLRSMPAIARASATAARLAAAATILLFWATLALLTNGSASLLPVLPWAPIAVVAASASATLFACAAILSGEPRTRGSH